MPTEVAQRLAAAMRQDQDEYALVGESVKSCHRPIEGVVYRLERKGKVGFLVRYVRPDKRDGIYLPELSGQAAVWNWMAWEPK